MENLVGTYNHTVRPIESPTSVGLYTLTISPPNPSTNKHNFKWVCQTLQDTPAEYDWRAQWHSLSGHVTKEDEERLLFTVESGKECIKSSGWSGNGVEDYKPFPSFSGKVVNGGEKVDVAVYSSILSLQKGSRANAVEGLIYPDYIFD
jgi:hypothetical protein